MVSLHGLQTWNKRQANDTPLLAAGQTHQEQEWHTHWMNTSATFLAFFKWNGIKGSLPLRCACSRHRLRWKIYLEWAAPLPFPPWSPSSSLQIKGRKEVDCWTDINQSRGRAGGQEQRRTGSRVHRLKQAMEGGGKKWGRGWTEEIGQLGAWLPKSPHCKSAEEREREREGGSPSCIRLPSLIFMPIFFLACRTAR